jgi:hypothetical protein
MRDVLIVRFEKNPALVLLRLLVGLSSRYFDGFVFIWYSCF